MKNIALVSLGCAKNLVDSEMILALVTSGDFQIVSDLKEADCVLLNTCAFILTAREEAIRECKAIRKKTKAKIVVLGCYPERSLEEVREAMPEADLFVPIRDYPRLHSILTSFLSSEKPLSPLDPLKRILATPSWSAYLRISEGCDNFCAFCAIPYIRGRFRSRTLDSLLEEAKMLKEKGVKELSIVSQDTAHYGVDLGKDGPRFLDLLKALDEMGFYSIRLFYLYPNKLNHEIIDFIAQSKSIAHYFDLPIQCASDSLLLKMNRHDSVENMRELISYILKVMPDAVLRTTLIVGFPGETEEDFHNTLDFIKEIRFHHLGCFRYSREEGTRAYDMPDQISEDVMRARELEIMGTQLQIAAERCREMVDKEVEGIVTGYDNHRHQYTFRCYWNAPGEIDANIYFSSPLPIEIGSIHKLKIINGFVRDLAGQLIE